MRPALALTLLSLACGSSGSPSVFSVSVQSGGSLTIDSIGGTLQLTATPKDSAGHTVSGAAVAWASTNTAVATVDNSGLVTAVAPGTVNIDATANGVTGKATVTVSPALGAVSVAPQTASIAPGETATFEADQTDAHGNPIPGGAVTWSSDATGVATVSSAGVATAVASGSANIKATSGAVSGTAALTVAAPGPAPASVTVSAGGASTTLTSIGDTVQLTAAATDSGGGAVTPTTLSWRSDDASVVIVLADGKVKATGTGTAHVVARANGVDSAATAFTVGQSIAQVSVTPSSQSISDGGTQQFTATARDAHGNAVAGAPAATWKSSNTSAATIDANGLATGTNGAAGSTMTTTITATISGVSGSAQLSVSGPGY